MIVMVCGLSGSGKSHLLQVADLASIGYQKVSASEILRREGRPTKGLSASAVDLNQQVIANYLNNNFTPRDRVVLDGHLLLETVDGPQLIPESSFAKIPLKGIIVIRTEEKILFSRRSRLGIGNSIEDLADLARIEELQARRMARSNGLIFQVIRESEPEELLKALRLASSYFV